MKKFLFLTGLVMAAVVFSVNVNAQIFYGVTKNPAQVKKIAKKELSGCKIICSEKMGEYYYDECKDNPLACVTSIFMDEDGKLKLGMVISYEKVVVLKTGKSVRIILGGTEHPATICYQSILKAAKAKRIGNDIVYKDFLDALSNKIPHADVLAEAQKLGIPFDETKLPFIIPL